jgi:hypothetical protein
MGNAIRKISIGPDYKSGAMHYIVGQDVLNSNYKIHLIKLVSETKSIVIYIQKEEEIVMWKEFTETVPVSIEYNINF